MTEDIYILTFDNFIQKIKTIKAMLFSENLVVFNVFYVNLGCLSIGWRLIYRLILNMQNLSAKSFFLLALSFFSFYPSHPSRFLFFNL